MSISGNALSEALDSAAEAAEAAAEDQLQAAAVARAAARRQRAGAAAADPEASERPIRRVLELLNQSTQSLGLAAGDLRRVWATALARDGLSIRQIGERLGVTHQRVSVLLSRGRSAGDVAAVGAAAPSTP